MFLFFISIGGEGLNPCTLLVAELFTILFCRFMLFMFRCSYFPPPLPRLPVIKPARSEESLLSLPCVTLSYYVYGVECVTDYYTCKLYYNFVYTEYSNFGVL